MKMSGVNDLIGDGTKFEGKLKSEGDVRIDGHFNGEISINGTLSVGESGLVEADIHAPFVVIGGRFHGNIFAGTRVEILPPANVYGEIEAPSIIMQDGAIFEGNCRMRETTEDEEHSALELKESDQPLVDTPPRPSDPEETRGPEAIS
jgi:cytoskeletal protein CcmA (bactofilin family)